MKTKSGFTLIEILIVIALIAILTTAGVGTYIASLQKSRDNTRKGNLRAITNALELYYNDNGRYPSGNANGAILGCNGGTGLSPSPLPVACTVNGAFQNANSTLYMAQLPGDPISSLKYYYISATGAQYQIYAHLENNQDSAINPTITNEHINCDNAGGTTYCNWGLSSANTNP